MAREAEEKGVSLFTKDAVESGGMFGPGEAHIKTCRFEMFEYKPKPGSKKKLVRAAALVVRYERDGEKFIEPYSVGNGWGIGKGGLSLVPRAGQDGLGNNTNAFYFIAGAEEAGMPADYLTSPDKLDGLDVVLKKKPIVRDFGEDKGGEKKSAILVIGEFLNAPWESNGKSKSKSKSRRDDDEEEDEKPTRKGKASDEDEDEEEDEKPAKGKANGRAKADEDEDEDEEAENDDVDDKAAEALIEALSGEDGQMKQDAIEKTIRKALKGHKQANVIAARASEDDFLEKEQGWTYNSKRGIVALDE